MAQIKKLQQKPIGFKIAVIAVPVFAALVIAALAISNRAGSHTASGGNTADATLSDNGDLIISISEVSEKAAFYPVEVDGTILEVIAVRAPDGTIRTALNTCQVCYDSGKGYYQQEGNTLVCQNCGNRFTMDQVEVASGGCNPVPIFSDYKIVNETGITISKDFLTEAKVIFEN